jgi:hypothetical protein
MGNTRNTGYLQNIVQYDASNNITLPAKLAVTGTVAINNTTPHDITQFSLDINGGLIVKNTGKTAQFVIINSNPATGGNHAFVQHTVGGTSGSSYADIQGYYGLAVTGSTVLRLNPLGGNVLIGSLIGTGTRVVVADATGVLSTQAIITLGDLSGVPTSRTLTINGVTYDLTANRSWSALPIGGVAGDILAKVDGTNYNATWIPNYTSQVQHQVKLGATMTAGTAVYVSGSTGNSGTNMIVSKASNAAESTSSKTLGLTATGGTTNDIVFVVTEGLLSGLDTSTSTAGDPVWLGVNGALIFGLLNKPVAPAHLVFIGVVTRVQQNNGEIFVKVQNGFEMNELHDYVESGVQNNFVISYESSTDLYKPKSIATLLGYTPANAARTITINGTSYDLSVDRSWTINSMVYPGAGIAVSTGTAWGTSLTDNSANWNTSFGWGNHASAGYLTGITSSQVTTALGYTPYNATNPSGYITSAALSTYATQTYVGTQIANLVASSPAALDTLNELAAALGNDAAFSTTVSTALGNRLRVDINTQGLSATLQGYGRTNLGLGTAAVSNTGDFAAASHTHSIANVTGLQTALDGKQASGSYAASSHSHIISDVTGLQTALDGKQASLGFTPYNSTNPSGYISSYTETSTLANVTARGASTTTRTTFVEVGVTKDGSDTVATGPWFRWTNAAETRQMLVQLNASNGLTYWSYNGTAWVSAMTLSQTGVLSTTGALSVGNSTEVNGLIQLGANGRYGMGVSGAYTNVYSHDSGLGVRLGSYNGTTFTPVLTAANTGAVTITGNVSAANLSGTNTGDQTTITGNAGSATLLKSINTTTSVLSNWNPQSLTYQAWGQAWAHSSISADTGDMVLWLRAGQYSAGGTEVCMMIDGDYYAGSGAQKVLHAGNYNSYAVPLGGGTMTGQLQINTPSNGVGSAFQLYSTAYHQYLSIYSNGSYEAMVNYRNTTTQWYAGLRTSAQLVGTDGFHFYNTTQAQTVAGFSNTGTIYSIGNINVNGEGNFGPDSGGDNGIRIRYGNGGAGYGRIRFHQDGTNHSTIHSFAATWQGGSFIGASAGAINIDGQYGATFGGWNVPYAHINSDGIYVKSWATPSGAMAWNSSAVLRLQQGSTGDNVFMQFRNRADVGDYSGILFSDNNIGGYLGFRTYASNDVGAGSDCMIYGTYNDHIFQNGSSGTFNGKTETFRIYANGSVRATGDVTAYSDRRVKENIITIDNALEKTLQLRGVFYNRTDKDDKSQKVGVIAQEIQEILPQVVNEDYNGLLSVSYGNITGVLIEAIKEQQTQIESQKSEIDELKDLVQQLINR